MARRDPNKFEVKGNPSIWVKLVRHGRAGDHDKNALWHYVFFHNGKRYRGSTGKIDQSEAEGVARSAAEKVRDTVHHSAAALTLSAAIEECLLTRFPDPQPEDRSYRDARNRLDAFAACVGKDTALSVLDVDAATALVQKYIDKRRADKISAQTIQNDRVVISKFFAWLMQRKRVNWQRNPAHKSQLDTPKVARVAAPPVSDDAAMKLLKAARQSPAFPAIVLCLSGMRPRGASRITWKDVDLDTGTIRPNEKGRERIIPLSDWAKGELKKWRASHPPHDESEPVISSHSALYKWMKSVKTSAGFEKGVSLQALRRTFLHRLFSAGVSPQVAAKLAGNSVQTIQKHYVDIGTMNANEAANVIDFSHRLTKRLTKKGKKRATA